MELYQHSPLPFPDSIRLVEIHPATNQNKQIQLSTYQTRLHDARKYEALSYEWGKIVYQKPVLCDGRALQVTTNLMVALKHLRLPEESRWIWIDAICIDQTNMEERSQQVAMMRDIYAHYSDGAVVANKKRCRSQAGDIRPPLRLEPSFVEKLSLQLKDKLLWKTLFDLFSATYFERTWIIQEIVVSTRATVVCGRQQISWKLFHWGESFIGTTTSLLHNAPDTELIQRMSAIITGIAEFKSRPVQNDMDPLSLYLRTVQASKSTDPRDKVFGILGLRYNEPFPHLARSLLRVDYLKSEQQVYQDAAEYIILTQQDLEICYGQALRSKKMKGLPSWVPDWSAREEGALSSTAFLTIHYKVRYTLPGKITFNNNSMFVDGHVLDTIDFTTKVMSSDAPLPEIKSIVIHLFKRAAPGCEDLGLGTFDMLPHLDTSIYKNGDSTFNALWRTLIGNTSNFEPAKPEFVRHFRAVLDILILRDRGIVFEKTKHGSDLVLDPLIKQKLLNDEIAQRFWQRAQERESHHFFLELVNTVQGRVFFTTSRGYMGFGMMGAKVGDQVCILGGGWNPFILRDHKSYFEMIGDSYLHGMMQGETLDLGKPKVERFRID